MDLSCSSTAVMEVTMQDPPPYNAAMVPSERTVIQNTPAPVVVQSTVQPPVTIVQQAPPPTIVQPAFQQAMMVVNPVGECSQLVSDLWLPRSRKRDQNLQTGTE